MPSLRTHRTGSGSAPEPARTADLSEEALDRLRDLLLAQRDERCAGIAENEAWLATATSDAFATELRRLARAAIRRDREAIEEIDRSLESLVETYGSCEWCGTVIPAERLASLTPGRLCQRCRQRNGLLRPTIDLAAMERAERRRRPSPCGRTDAPIG